MTFNQSKKSLVGGIFLLIGLLISLLVVWLNGLIHNSNLLQNLTDEQLKAVVITAIRDTSHRRRNSLQQIIYLKDPFDRKQEYTRFSKLGLVLSSYHDKLFSMRLNEYQKSQLEEVKNLLSEMGKNQKKIIQLIFEEDNLETARSLLQEELAPKQDQFSATLSEMLDNQQKNIVAHTAEAKAQKNDNYLPLGLLIATSFLLGIFAIYAIRRTSSTERTLLNQAKNIRALYGVASIPNMGLKKQINEMLKLGCQLLGTDIGMVCEIDLNANKNVCINQYHTNSTEKMQSTDLPLSDTFCYLTVNSDKPIAISDTSKSEYRGHNFYRVTGVNTYIANRITIDGKIFGTVCFSSQQARPTTFNETHVDLLDLISNWLTVSLQRQFAQQKLSEAKEAAENTNKTKSTFLANMSHELRTALNAIIGYGELLAEQAAEEKRNDTAEDLAKIIDSGHHLFSLIDGVLDLSKIEAGHMDLQLESVNIQSIMSDVTNVLAPTLAKNKNILSVDNRIPDLEVYADKIKLKQVLVNLLSNANNFTENGKIGFSTFKDNSNNKDWIIFNVKDNGIGMSEEQIDELFVAFTQSKKNNSTQFDGTGLALTISRLFCNMMGGDILVTSKPNEGSTFTVRLPASAPS